MSSRQPFRLLDLPLEIQRLIYDRCLISPSPITISIDTSDGTWGFSNHIPRDKATAYEGLVELTSDHSNLDHLIRTQPDAAARRNINVNLLRVSKTVYTEAASILYSRNTFRFEGDKQVPFPFFIQRLTETGIASIGSLDLEFPILKADGYGSAPAMSTYTRWFVNTLNRLHGIRTLRLRLHRFELSDLQVLEDFPCRTPTRNIIVDTCHLYFLDEPTQRMVLGKFRQWGWEVIKKSYLQNDDNESD